MAEMGARGSETGAIELLIAGSTPAASTVGPSSSEVERRTEDAGVGGSTPSSAIRTFRSWHSVPDAEFIAAVREGTSAQSVMERLGRPVSGNGYNNVQRRVRRLGLDTSHWRRNRPGTENQWTRRPLAEWLVPGMWVTNRPSIKRRLIEAGLLAERCAVCDAPPFWNGRPLTLVLDHINGVPDDWRVENLRFVCPNCNAQLPTHCGRNARRRAVAHAEITTWHSDPASTTTS